MAIGGGAPDHPARLGLLFHSTTDIQLGVCGPTSCRTNTTKLHACRETRNMKRFRKHPLLDPTKGYTWINFNTDVIDIGANRFSVLAPVAPLIKRLMFESRLRGSSWSEGAFCSGMKELGDFVNVQEIYIACYYDIDAWHGASRDCGWPCGPENLYLVSRVTGKLIKATKADEMIDERIAQALAEDN